MNICYLGADRHLLAEGLIEYMDIPGAGDSAKAKKEKESYSRTTTEHCMGLQHSMYKCLLGIKERKEAW